MPRLAPVMRAARPVRSVMGRPYFGKALGPTGSLGPVIRVG
jgi:hypothetical protein